MTKPADFMLGLLDFFGVLLPGAVAAALVKVYLPPEMQRHLTLESGERTDVLPWIVFLLSAYTLGHFVFLLGSHLDPLYDRWRKRAKPAAHDVGYNAAKNLREKLTPALVGGGLSLFKWARAFIEIHSPGSKLEIDRLEASSKFFRGLVVVSVPWMIHLMVARPDPHLAVGDGLACGLSFWRFCDQRWKMTELTYATAVIAYETKIKSTDASRPKKEEDGAAEDATQGGEDDGEDDDDQ
jgi:hypothetical protein